MPAEWELLDEAEKMTLAFRSLYMRRGYTRYRMGKFEEYDLYSRNKDFLVSGQIITFTDTNGALMALRPDVTLSIVKNLPDAPETLRKLCYSENVYRAAQGGGAFREMMQTGIECLGQVDALCVGEVLSLAAESLSLCSQDYVLELSDLDVLSSFVDAVSPDGAGRRAILKYVSEKNAHAIAEVCRENGVSAEQTDALLSLLRLYGSPAEVLPKLRELCAGRELDTALDELEKTVSVPAKHGQETHIQLDFSAVGNMKYYNGVLFRGFIRGISGSVLSGGRYDRLMRRMGKKSGAVGFAIYLDRLERLKWNGGVEINA